ncbi:MAG: tRNA (adenosine(37)-N6)-threonylcarbamoyltransferase complex transferase subunit TsaD, partial [Chloroflexi bacterium]|nr:tRNA (adenosine(37)-N6)-threonylcarbamoyltransferase complex transferase subunit TsaD [Chloroflexota bacterium]
MTAILAIETSCDETAAAVITDGLTIRSNIVASQIDLHAQYGGVFPELASRAHAESISAVVGQAMTEAAMTYADLDALAVTQGPGLVGSLLVGINFAKGLALATGLPLLGINH